MTVSEEEIGQLFRNFVSINIDPMLPLIQDMKARFESREYWDSVSWTEGAAPTVECPIQRYVYRVKQEQSFRRKVSGRPEGTFIGGEGELTMNDILGCRIVTYFSGMFPQIHRGILEYPGIRVVPDKSIKVYDAHEAVRGLSESEVEEAGIKNSGYRSIHYPVFFENDSGRTVEFEIQVRTILSDAWGEIDHKLGYKPGSDSEHVVNRQLQVMAAHLRALDEHADLLFDRVRYLGNRPKLTNASMLDRVAANRLMEDYSVSCSQEDATFVAEECAGNGIHSVGAFRELATRDFFNSMRSKLGEVTGSQLIGPREFVTVVVGIRSGLSLDDAVRALTEEN